MPFLYRSILLKAARIALKHRWLWFFGLLLAPLVNGGAVEILYRGVTLNPAQSTHWIGVAIENTRNLATVDALGGFVDLLALPRAQPFPSVLLIATLLVISVAIARTMVISAGGIAYAVKKLANNEKMTLDQSYRAGLADLKSNTLLVGGAVAALILLLSLMRWILTFTLANPTAEWMLFTTLLTLLIVLTVLVYYITQYGVAFITLKRLPLSQALAAAFHLVRRSWLINIELTLILFLITLVLGLMAFAITFIFVAVPLAYLAYVTAQAGLIEDPNAAVPAIRFVLLVFNAVVWSILATFQAASWILLFQRLTTKSEWKAKIVRMWDVVKELRGITRHATEILEPKR